MSDEDREVVQYFTQFIPFMWWRQPDENGRLKIDVDLLHKIETILNLVQKQQTELEKKDKIIDEMSDMLVRVHSENKKVEFIANADIEEKKQKLKQYFEKKVEGK